MPVWVWTEVSIILGISVARPQTGLEFVRFGFWEEPSILSLKRLFKLTNYFLYISNKTNCYTTGTQHKLKD